MVAYREVLAAGDCRVDFFGERLGVWHADDDSAVFVVGQVDLKRLGAASPGDIGDVAAPAIGAQDEEPRNRRARKAHAQSAQPAFVESLSAGHVWCPHLDALVKTPKRLARSELDHD